MMTDKYVLDSEGQPVPEPDLMKWASWFEQANGPDREHMARNVAWSKIGPFTISTVFLGLDHSFGDGPPVLWETMVFGPEPWDDWQQRWTSRGAAEAGHTFVYDLILQGSPPPD